MKFIKFLSLITIITYAPALYSMEDNTLQEQSRVPKLVDLCSFKQINAIWKQCQNVTGATLDQTLGAINQDIFPDNIPQDLNQLIEAHFCKQKGWHVPHCLKEFNNVNGLGCSPDSSLTLVKYWGGGEELINTKTREVIRDNVYRISFAPDSSLIFVEHRKDNNGNYRGELINAKTDAAIKVFDNVFGVNFSSDSSLLFIQYLGNNRGELIDTKTGEVIKEFNNVKKFYFSRDSSLRFYRYEDGRGELLCTGNFEQIIFKCALRNMFKAHKEQQSTDIKQGLTTLLNHQILTKFPQQAQDRLSKEITDVLQDKDSSAALEPPNKRQKT